MKLIAILLVAAISVFLFAPVDSLVRRYHERDKFGCPVYRRKDICETNSDCCDKQFVCRQANEYKVGLCRIQLDEDTSRDADREPPTADEKERFLSKFKKLTGCQAIVAANDTIVGCKEEKEGDD
ncbi:hypothetical protein HDE_10482 [Halotydeus destructor]|nr:hypothetical protein HDE_10482 [Halotydeus destructor]